MVLCIQIIYTNLASFTNPQITINTYNSEWRERKTRSSDCLIYFELKI